MMERKTTEPQDKTDVNALRKELTSTIRDEGTYSALFKGPDEMNGTLRACRETLHTLNKLANHKDEVSELELKELLIRKLADATQEYVENALGDEAIEYRKRKDYLQDMITNIWVYRLRQ